MEASLLLEKGKAPAVSRTVAASAGNVPELLAPAGDWDCARAAVENGADAIYFGLEKFNARMRAHNFTEADLPDLMAYLHRRGCKGYVTFNTLVFENELAEAEQYLRAIIASGVDAAIVQDVGICRLIRAISPDFPIHVSTQMTITSAAGVEFARELGCNLVVLARECSLQEIEKIQASQKEDPVSEPGESSPRPAFPLEVFVHGALCVAYSGQCLTSEALGGRSANRGECAQACRMPYELIADGKLLSLGDRRYLLSPQDLAGLEVLPQLAKLGVASLKIEGRLKSAEYVANITRVYRQALDGLSAAAFQGEGSNRADGFQAEAQYRMEMAFSRGLYTGWFRGINNQELVHARFGKKRGVYLGEVLRLERDRVVIELLSPVKAGDGVVFDAGRPEDKEEGGRIYAVDRKEEHLPCEARLTFGRGDIDFDRVQPGNKVWKTSDPELDRELRQSFEGETPRFCRPLTFEVHGSAGLPMTLIARDGSGHVAQIQSAMPLAQARKQPLTTERLREQLERLGGTPFELGELKNLLPSDTILPVSELNRMRRAVVTILEQQRAQPCRWQIHENRGLKLKADAGNADAGVAAAKPRLIVLTRNLSQLQAALDSGIETLYCEFEDPKKYREAVALARNWPTGPKRELFAAPPRIFKSGEEWTLQQVRSSEADGYLARNYDHLKFFASDRCIGDFSFNIANHFSVEYFKTRFGLERLTASYDLNFGQLEALLRSATPSWFEIAIHQHMPMFHMEHCVFCAFLSQGTDYRNCGRPCDRHDLKLRDRVGAEHPVKADVGCRNTVFHALAQTGAEYVEKMIDLGVRDFRLEFLNETAVQVASAIARYRQLLRGEITGQELWRELKLLNQLGVTRGQLAG